MSQSPSAASPGNDPYRRGWLAVNRLMREGWSWSGHERNTVFWNRPDGAGFADVSGLTGFDDPDDGRALARVDWDLDGDLDLVLSARTGPRLRLFENRLDGPNGWIALWLEGRTSEEPVPAIGARVRVWRAGAEVPLVEGLRAGEGFLAQSSSWLHFGLGPSAVEAVEVRWPDGRVQRFEDVQANRRYVLRYGVDAAEPWSPPAAFRTLPEPDPAAPPLPVEDGPSAAIVLAAPIPMPTLTVMDASGQGSALFGIQPGRSAGSGFPVLLSFFSRTCASCAAELRAFEVERAAWTEAGLSVVPLAVDDPSELDAVRAFLERAGWSSLWGFASPSTIEVVDALVGAVLDTEQRSGLPLNLLIDADGRLCAFWLGSLEPRELVDGLLGFLDTDPQRRRDRAVPFRGRWRSDPPEPDWAYLEHFARKRGLADTAREFHLGPLDVRPTSRSEVEYRFGRVFAERGDYAQAIPHFEAALGADPYFFAAQRDLALALHLSGRFEEAIVEYDEALLLAPEHEDTIFDRALAQAGLDRRDDAWRSVERLEALAPERAAELRQRLEAIFTERDG